jgi:cob(I)alamin adenosyltransferase
MSKTKFYTGKGDKGDTGRLGGGKRLPKDSNLIRTIGTLDEANAALGNARSLVQETRTAAALLQSQRCLYRLMSHLSAMPEMRQEFPGLLEEDVAWLEEIIGWLEGLVPQLKGFVVPGDSPAGAACHVARTVVRRAERRLVAFADEESNVGPANLAFINRLSSFLFVAALREDGIAGEEPTLASPERT